MKSTCTILLGLCLLLAVETPASGDSVTLAGSAIPIRNCTIQAIRGGSVFFLDSLDQQQRRSLEQVQALGFDGLGPLDEAERAIAVQDYTAALGGLLRALLAADTDVQRLWVHGRLARVHNVGGEYIQAAGHAAAVFTIEQDPYWRRLEPLCEVNEPTYAAAHEAMQLLQRADRTVSNPQLASLVDRLLATIRPIHERLERTYQGPPIEPGSTISGISKVQIARSGGAAPDPPDVARPQEKSAPPPQQSARPAPDNATAIAVDDGDSPDAIDALLASGRPGEAVTACLRVARDPGHRDLGRFLHQYGLALEVVGREADAAVMFMRCVVLFPASPHASGSLMETAQIYRRTYGKPQTTRRLLNAAIAKATAQGQPAAAERARRILESLDAEAAP